ncbi:unnamed protein product [Gadus morhua 'NCC']
MIEEGRYKVFKVSRHGNTLRKHGCPNDFTEKRPSVRPRLSTPQGFDIRETNRSPQRANHSLNDHSLYDHSLYDHSPYDHSPYDHSLRGVRIGRPALERNVELPGRFTPTPGRRCGVWAEVRGVGPGSSGGMAVSLLVATAAAGRIHRLERNGRRAGRLGRWPASLVYPSTPLNMRMGQGSGVGSAAGDESGGGGGSLRH